MNATCPLCKFNILKGKMARNEVICVRGNLYSFYVVFSFCCIALECRV
ncbi:unnamed protein product [Arabidopsis halleri]